MLLHKSEELGLAADVIADENFIARHMAHDMELSRPAAIKLQEPKEEIASDEAPSRIVSIKPPKEA